MENLVLRGATERIYLAETAQIAFIRHGWTVPVFKSSRKAGPFRNSHLPLE